MQQQTTLDRDRYWQEARGRLLSDYTQWLATNHKLYERSLQTMEESASASASRPDVAPVRRKRRNSALDSPQKRRNENKATDSGQGTLATTPLRRSKRVRFSGSALPSNTEPLTTGITPYLRRSSLGTPRRQRPGTPAANSLINEMQFTPLRQVLDERVKRRIRRNGLSSEMNEYEADRRTNMNLQKRIDEKDAELKRLRAELQATASRLPQLEDQYSIPQASQERVDEVAAELEALRQSFALEESEPVITWNHVRLGQGGPYSEGGDTVQIYEDHDADQEVNTAVDTDALTMGLELEAARQAKKSLLGSFRESASFTELNFADSPARRHHKAVGTSPQTPRTFYHDLSKQLKTTTSRAEDAELALKSLEDEINSLGFGSDLLDGKDAVAAIADHFRQARLDLERVLPGETVISFENAKVMPEIMNKLKSLAHRLRGKETELQAAKDQHRNLKVNFEKAIIAAEKATGRVRDLESSIDTTAEEMLNLRIRSQNLEKDLDEKEKDIRTLTTALDKYRADVTRLENLITNLEDAHASTSSSQSQAISDLDAKVAAETRGRRAAEVSAVARLAKISELEAALSTAKRHAGSVEEAVAKLRTQLENSSRTHAQEVGGLNSRIDNLSTALASANAEVEKLKATKIKLEERVRMEVEQGARAVETIQANLIRSIAKTNEDKKSYIRGAKVRTANWEIESDGLESDGVEPLTPASMVKFAEFSEEISHSGTRGRRSRENSTSNEYELPFTIEIGRGSSGSERSRSRERRMGLGITKPRRRYDSGIGMSPISEPDNEIDAIYGCADHVLTPAFGSDLDVNGADDYERSINHTEMAA